MALEFPLKSFVKTICGYGEVVSYDSKSQMYRVQLTSWELSDRQPVLVNSQASSLKSIVGLFVKTPYGSGRVIDFGGGVYKIRLTSWMLSNNMPVYVNSTVPRRLRSDDFCATPHCVLCKLAAKSQACVFRSCSSLP